MAALKPRVLMVDDEPDFHVVVRSWLGSDYELVSSTDASRLEAQLAAVQPDLLILDVRLPGADGFELCDRLRAERRWDALPILLVTGRRAADNFERHVKAGGTAYLMKPVGRRRLLSTLRELLPDPGESVGTVD